MRTWYDAERDGLRTVKAIERAAQKALKHARVTARARAWREASSGGDIILTTWYTLRGTRRESRRLRGVSNEFFARIERAYIASSGCSRVVLAGHLAEKLLPGAEGRDVTIIAPLVPQA